MGIEAEEMALCGLLPSLSPSVLLKLVFFLQSVCLSVVLKLADLTKIRSLERIMIFF